MTLVGVAAPPLPSSGITCCARSAAQRQMPSLLMPPVWQHFCTEQQRHCRPSTTEQSQRQLGPTIEVAALPLPVPASVVTSNSPWKVVVMMLERLGLPPATAHGNMHWMQKSPTACNQNAALLLLLLMLVALVLLLLLLPSTCPSKHSHCERQVQCILQPVPNPSGNRSAAAPLPHSTKQLSAHLHKCVHACERQVQCVQQPAPELHWVTLLFNGEAPLTAGHDCLHELMGGYLQQQQQQFM